MCVDVVSIPCLLDIHQQEKKAQQRTNTRAHSHAPILGPDSPGRESFGGPAGVLFAVDSFGNAFPVVVVFTSREKPTAQQAHTARGPASRGSTESVVVVSSQTTRTRAACSLRDHVLPPIPHQSVRVCRVFSSNIPGHLQRDRHGSTHVCVCCRSSRQNRTLVVSC